MNKYYVYLPVVKLVPKSLTEGRDTLCLPAYSNYKYILNKYIFIYW